MLLSIISPTYNEADNIYPFIEKINKSLNTNDYEIIFVDDNSPDDTHKIIKKASKTYTNVRCIRRIGRRGLSSAVIEGALSSSADFLVIIDADLQHDEKLINKMLELAKKEFLDVVVASRFKKEKKSLGLSTTRNYISRFANFLANKITNTNLSDPMSGFFLIKRSVFEDLAINLKGYGFKILLDIFASSNRRIKYKEVSFNFRKRIFGNSKLDSLVVWEYFLLLWDSRMGKILPARFLSFCIIGGSGVIVHLTILYVLISYKAVFLYAQTISTFFAMTSNFFLNNILTYSDRRKRGIDMVKALFIFYLTCGLGAFANIGVANFIYNGSIAKLSGMWFFSGLIGAFVGALWNYMMSSQITWKNK
tara:strand:+ start:1912 stop:3003 length:1092 start_codon:yes stop_codon:yes gene_type:complete